MQGLYSRGDTVGVAGYVGERRKERQRAQLDR